MLISKLADGMLIGEYPVSEFSIDRRYTQPKVVEKVSFG